MRKNTKRSGTARGEASGKSSAPPPEARTARPSCIVCIGASAGGLEAFTALLKEIPPDTGLGFVFVQHLSPGHTSMLPEILARATRMPVCEVRDEPLVQPNHVYVIPPGRTMVIEKGSLSLSPRGEGQHHPVDLFMMALATDQGHRAIGVVLSGTATDGTLGLGSIKEAGGITFAQDESALHDGMPRSARAAAVVDFVLSPQRIAHELTRIAREPYVIEAAGDALAPATGIEQILTLLRQEHGIDFAQYKPNTLHRRIKRRMVLLKMPTLPAYAEFLRSSPAEVELLYQDILISVTNFFRNPEAFEALTSKVIPKLFKERDRQNPLRIWVLGCSTGEEAYSLAIAVSEYAAAQRSPVPIMIYATDLNGVSVERARLGRYPKSIAKDVSPERLRRFFVESDGGYRVAKSIRDLCIFARHNILADPPFSRMDLIACRNVMIYMEAPLQRQLMPILHYALKSSGFLFLGPSETIGPSAELFEPEDLKHRIYLKKETALRLDRSFPFMPHVPRPVERPSERWREAERAPQPDLQREAERVLLLRYVPAGVLVNSELDVLQFRGETGLYLTPAPGKASLNVLKMAREGLLVPLRTLLQRAKKENASVRENEVRVRSNGGFHDIAVSVIPIGAAASAQRCYWVLFENRAGAAAEDRPARAPKARAAEKAGHLALMTQELEATREYLQSVIEQQEAANEELQSANEEVQSANEELQSINEELETSKEEIQSSNEELSTVNEELQNRVEELNRANNDLNNLFGSIQMAVVMVWPDLRIRRFTPTAEKLLNLIAADIGRPIGDVQLNLNLSNVRELLTDAIDSVTPRELEVQDRQGRWYLLRIRPYRTLDNRIDGAVLALVDIDLLKQSQDVLQRHARILEQTHDAVLVRELDGTIVYWNHGAEALYGYSRAEAQLRLSHELFGSHEQQRKAVDVALASKGQWSGELLQRTRDGRELVIDNRQVVFTEGDRRLVLETTRDISERRRLETRLRERVEELAGADQRKNEFLAMLAHELRNPLAPLRNAVQIMKMVAPGADAALHARELLDRQVATLSRLVDDLLDAAHVSRGHVQLRVTEVDLQKVVQLAIETTRAVFETRHHHLTVTAPPAPLVIEGDPMRLEQVVANLLLNAAKYTPDGGAITLTIEQQEVHASPLTQQAVVRVRDNGIGIEPALLNRVFELFFQGDQSLGRGQGGLGIGLSLVRTLVELHGGRVEAFSAGRGRGSEFVVYLPVTAAGKERAARAAESGRRTEVAAAQRATQRVLVVDDNRDIAESTSKLLNLSGHETKVALSGEEALRVVASFRPDTVLLDIGMPGMDGYQLCRELRRKVRGQQPRFVAVTGYGAAQNRARAREAGFDEYLLKPVDLDTLNDLLKPSPGPQPS